MKIWNGYRRLVINKIQPHVKYRQRFIRVVFLYVYMVRIRILLLDLVWFGRSSAVQWCVLVITARLASKGEHRAHDSPVLPPIRCYHNPVSCTVNCWTLFVLFSFTTIFIYFKSIWNLCYYSPMVGCSVRFSVYVYICRYVLWVKFECMVKVGCCDTVLEAHPSST